MKTWSRTLEETSSKQASNKNASICLRARLWKDHPVPGPVTDDRSVTSPMSSSSAQMAKLTQAVVRWQPPILPPLDSLPCMRRRVRTAFHPVGLIPHPRESVMGGTHRPDGLRILLRTWRCPSPAPAQLGARRLRRAQPAALGEGCQGRQPLTSQRIGEECAAGAGPDPPEESSCPQQRAGPVRDGVSHAALAQPLVVQGDGRAIHAEVTHLRGGKLGGWKPR